MSSYATRRHLLQSPPTPMILAILVLWLCIVSSSVELESGFLTQPDDPQLQGYIPRITQPPPFNTSMTTCQTESMATALYPTSTKESPVGDDENEINSFLRVDNDKLIEEMMFSALTTDGSGETTETTTTAASSTTTSSTETSLSSTTPRLSTSLTTAEPIIDLSGLSHFIVTLLCENASSIFHQILTEFNLQFTFVSQINFDNRTLLCPRSTETNINFSITTERNVTAITELYRVLRSITSALDIKLNTTNQCTNGESVEVPEVDVCYVIALCSLCGRSPPRGVCLPQSNVSRCQCFANANDPSMIYTGEFCRPERAPITSPTSSLSGSTAVIVGVVAGIAGLFVVITAYLLIMSYYRNRRRRRLQRKNAEPQTTVNRLPRVAIPAVLPDANYQLETSVSTVESVVEDSEPTKNETSDPAFFEELDDLIKARSIRSGPKQMFMMDEFLKGAITSSEHRDRINELDAIIDNEDIGNLFRDITSDTDSHDYSIFEAVNPNLRLPRTDQNSTFV